MHAGFLELLGPLDVVGFVEAGLEFDERGNLLAVVRGLDERTHERRVATGAVERLLDGEDLGVAGGLLDKIDDGLERIVGVMQEYILNAQRIENARGLGERRRVDRGERSELQVGAFNVGEGLKAEEIDRAVDAVDVVFRDGEILAEQFEKIGVHAVFDFKAHGGSAAEIAEFVFDFLQQIFGFLFVDVEIAVAGDAESMGGVEPVAGEELAGANFDDLAEENGMARAAGLGRGNLHEAGQDARHGQNRDVPLDFGRRGIVERNDDVERLVAELGKRM